MVFEFATRNDTNQIQVTAAQLKKLQKLHPSTLTELADKNGPVIWVLVIPTTTSVMNEFLRGKISEKTMLQKTKVGDLLPQLKTQALPSERKQQIMEMLETILISKFPKLTRQEIEAMLKIESLRNTRVFQEGVEQGRQAAAREILLQLLTHKFGSLSTKIVSQIQTIDSTEKLEQLPRTLFDAPDLQTFLQNL